jgi:hypothetical protein
LEIGTETIYFPKSKMLFSSSNNFEEILNSSKVDCNIRLFYAIESNNQNKNDFHTLVQSNNTIRKLSSSFEFIHFQWNDSLNVFIIEFKKINRPEHKNYVFTTPILINTDCSVSVELPSSDYFLCPAAYVYTCDENSTFILGSYKHLLVKLSLKLTPLNNTNCYYKLFDQTQRAHKEEDIKIYQYIIPGRNPLNFSLKGKFNISQLSLVQIG